MATGLFAGILALLALRFGGELSRSSGDAAQPIPARLRAGFRLVSKGGFIAPVVVLTLFASAAGFVNYKRFGNPLEFGNFSIQTHLPTSHGVHIEGVPALERYGAFNPRRIPYGLMYYFVPVWFVHSADGGLLFDDYRRRELDLAEPPPSSFFPTDPLLLMSCSRLRALALSGGETAWR
jgi:hypothetical protein